MTVDAVDVIALRQRVDAGVVESALRGEGTRLGVQLTLTWVDDPDQLTAGTQLADVQGKPMLILASAACGALAQLPPGSARTVRVDLGTVETDYSAQLLAHVQGRGIGGLGWGLRALVHRLRSPAVTLRYGEHPDQYGHLRTPTGTSARLPVAVLLHGGFWRSKWQMDLMDALAVDLAERGFASWNVEYRRPDRHGWQATAADAEDAVRHLWTVQEPALDLERVVLVGHSAGGQLALRAAADLARHGTAVPAMVVSLAGVLDLHEAHDRDLGDGAVRAAIGNGPEEDPETYMASSPLSLLPTRVPTLVVTACGDNADLNDMSRRYVASARSAGDRIMPLEGDGDHFTLIDPQSQAWAETVAHTAAGL